MNVGVIGTGVMGVNHVRVYSKIRETDEIYVFDSMKNKVNVLKKFGVINCGSLDELLNKVDAVSICVPTENHFKVAKKVIDNNVPCLIEKPLTSTIREGKDLLERITRTSIVAIGHIERFNPIVEEINKIIHNVRYCEIKRHNPASVRIKDVSVVKDLMIHDIDIVFNVLFQKKKYHLYSAGNQEVISSLLNFGNSVVSLSASNVSSKKIRSIYVEDKDFTVEGDFMLQEIYVYKKPEKYGITDERYIQENIIEKVLINKVEPLYVELETFLRCVETHKEFPVTPEQALNNLKICEEIEKGYR
jgi:predicted dehydrogenase